MGMVEVNTQEFRGYNLNEEERKTRERKLKEKGGKTAILEAEERKRREGRGGGGCYWEILY